MQMIIGVGSNKGNREAFIQRARQQLEVDECYRVLAEAPFFENPAQGGPSGQGDFLNTAWLIETNFGPHQCLHRLQGIEQDLGRIRTVENGVRTIDLDLLLCDAVPIIDNAVLSIPHPRMLERDFVMRPINAIAPDWIHPIVGQSMNEIFERNYV